jgi:DNA-binding CsgD family transcriptional regulator
LGGAAPVTHPVSRGASHPSQEGNRNERNGCGKSPLSRGVADVSAVAIAKAGGRGVFTRRDKPASADFDDIKVEKKTLSTKLTQLETLDLFLKGKSIAEISVERGFSENTIYGHLEFLIEKGLIKNIDKLVDAKKQDKIFAVIKKVGADKLTPIKDELGDDYSWEEIKLTRAKFLSKK